MWVGSLRWQVGGWVGGWVGKRVPVLLLLSGRERGRCPRRLTHVGGVIAS